MSASSEKTIGECGDSNPEARITKCRNCGTDNPDDASLCGKCGATLPIALEPKPPPTIERELAEIRQGIEYVEWFIVALLFLGLIWFFAWLMR